MDDRRRDALYRLRLTGATLALLVAGPAAVPAQGTAPDPQEQQAARPRVVVIGASVSAGFVKPLSVRGDGRPDRSWKLDHALKLAWPTAAARIDNFANMAMFLNPVASGKQQLELARRARPDLVIGADFPFWFGYGGLGRTRAEHEAGGGGKGGADSVDPRRLARQQQGLALLAMLPCPIVLGDYPDMRGADPTMLPPRSVPNVATLAALNAGLREWAKGRDNVTVFPLAEFVQQAVSSPLPYAYGQAEIVFPPGFLLQSDRLHATCLGMLVLTDKLLAAVPRVLPARHPLLALRPDFQTLVRRGGIEADLPPEPSPPKSPPKSSPVPSPPPAPVVPEK